MKYSSGSQPFFKRPNILKNLATQGYAQILGVMKCLCLILLQNELTNMKQPFLHKIYFLQNKLKVGKLRLYAMGEFLKSWIYQSKTIAAKFSRCASFGAPEVCAPRWRTT